MTDTARLKTKAPAIGRYRLAITTILLLGVSFTFAAFVLIWRAELHEYNEKFDYDATMRTNTIVEYLNAELQDLDALRRFVEGAGHFDQNSFQAFVKPMLDRKGIQAVEWIPVVPSLDRETVEAAAKREGLDAYKIQERSPDGALTPAKHRDCYYPVYYVEPKQGNEKAIGFDLGSSPVRLDAINAALRSGNPQATGRIILIQEKEKQNGFLVFAPVRSQNKKVLGFALAVFRAGDMLQNAIKQTEALALDTSLNDLSAPFEQREFYHWQAKTISSPQILKLKSFLFPLPEQNRTFGFAGRTWNLHVTATPEYRSGTVAISFFVILPAGFLLTAILALYLHVLHSRRHMIEVMVQERTSELFEANSRLSESERKFKAVADNSPLAIYMAKGIEQKGEYINPTFVNLFGYTLDDVPSLEQWLPLAYPDEAYRQELYEEWHRRIKIAIETSSEIEPMESVVTCKDGSLKHIQWGFKSFGDQNWSFGLDLTERIRADQLLREREEKYRQLFNNAEIAMFRSEFDGSDILDVNQKFLDIVGKTREETIGKPSVDLWADLQEYNELVRKISEDGRVSGYEFRMLDNQGNIKNCILSLVLYREQGVLEGSILDISKLKHAEAERLHLEKQLLHTQKLESLGMLAGGIAHDFNNILMVIMGNAELALMHIDKKSPVANNLNQIEHASARAADLATQMLAYSGKGKFIIESINLNRLIEDMHQMLEVSVSKKAMLKLDLSPYLPPIEADPTQMQQIVMNLVINASEAIGDRNGFITVTTRRIEYKKKVLREYWKDWDIGEGLYVYLEVSDSGCGMNDETLKKIFDPFFSTKFMGRGLGLAAVHGIVRAHKGAISVDSKPDKGTSFKLLLPASGEPAELSVNNDHQACLKAEGKVLLVDDEEMVRSIAKNMLNELGYDVIMACDGIEALEVFKATPDISFVILDLTMPHMDGKQCFQELRKIKPDTKVFISSGFSVHEISQETAGSGLAGVIQKPYKLSVLKESLQSPLFWSQGNKI